MNTINRFGVALDRRGASPETTSAHPRPSQGYSSAVDAAIRLEQRRHQHRWWAASETGFGLLGRVLITAVVLSVPAVLVFLGVQYSLSALVLLFLACPPLAMLLKDIWVPRR